MLLSAPVFGLKTLSIFFSSCFSSRYFSSMLYRLFLLAVVLSLPAQSIALALGDVIVRSALGQVLDADIDMVVLSAQEAESLSVKLAPAEMFAEAGLDYGVIARSVRLSVEKKAGRTHVHLSSDKVITEPFLMLLIEVSAGGNRSVRQYALLLDPPSTQDNAPVVTAPPVFPKLAAEPIASTTPTTPTTSSAVKTAAVTKPSKLTKQGAKLSQVREATKVTKVTKEDATETKASSSDIQPTTRLVKSGDTLRQIATSVQPSGATPAQVMMAILQENSQAFEQKNIHRMKAGVVLTIPESSVMLSIDAQQAMKQVQLQTRDFNHASLARKKDSAVNPQNKTAAESKPANQSHSGSLSKSATEPPSAAPKDQLKLSAPDSSEKSSLDLKELEKLANEKSLAESNLRIAQLEKNIHDLQTQLVTRDQSVSPEPAPHEAADKAKDAAPAAAVTATVTPQSNKVSVKPTAVADSENDYLAEVKKFFEFESFFDVEKISKEWDSESLVPIGIATGASLAGLLFLLRRQRRHQHRKAMQSQRIEPEADAGSVFGHAGGGHVDTNHSVFHSNFVPSVSKLDANEVDAIAEADVYIAYGRDEQAEEILLDALKAHPARHVLRVKLLEIYAARKDQKKFSALASELRVLTHAQGAEWMQAAQLAQKMEVGNPLTTSGSPMRSFKEPSGGMNVANANAHLPSKFTSSLNDQPATTVADFSISLDGMLQEGREGSSIARPASSTATAEVIDFTQTGVTSKTTFTRTHTQAETLALKTKLDLAVACNEIGDNDGARDLLREVASSQHAELAPRAKSLLQQLA
jgi:pilus assembly protein FimV